MAYQIRQSKLVLRKLTNVLEYLEEAWSKQVANEFREKLEKKLLLLTHFPNIGKNCKGVANAPHNKLFYRIKGKTIYIITLFDTRQNPQKNNYE